MSSEYKLELCPFCGANPELFETSHPLNYGVRCSNFSCYVRPRTRLCGSKANSSVIWNKRYIPSLYKSIAKTVTHKMKLDCVATDGCKVSTPYYTT